MELVRDPYLERLRAEISELKRLVDGEPNEIVVTQAWTVFSRLKDALGHLCPNHPMVYPNFR